AHRHAAAARAARPCRRYARPFRPIAGGTRDREARAPPPRRSLAELFELLFQRLDLALQLLQLLRDRNAAEIQRLLDALVDFCAQFLDRRLPGREAFLHRVPLLVRPAQQRRAGAHLLLDVFAQGLGPVLHLLDALVQLVADLVLVEDRDRLPAMADDLAQHP